MSTTRIFKTADRRGGGTVVVVWPRATPARLRAADGGSLAFNGGTIVFPPDAFVDMKGRRVTGDVEVAVSVLDLANPRQLASAPGDFTARMRDSSIRPLETFGVFEIVATDRNGRRANLAAGQTATVALLLSPALRTTPDVVGLFSFETTSGRWIEEGTLTRSATPPALNASIRALGWWNADQVTQTTCIKLHVLDCTCGTTAPVSANAQVTATGVGYVGAIAAGDTDPAGDVCLSVKRGATVSVIAHHPTENIQSHPQKITTPAHVASAADCTNAGLCPLVATIRYDMGFTYALQADSTQWCKAHEWTNNTGDPNFNVGWRKEHISFSPSGMTLRLADAATVTTSTSTTIVPCSPTPVLACSGQPFVSGEYRSKCTYGHGTYTATFQAPQGSGLMTSFFVRSDDGDEIDVEVFGRTDLCPANHTRLQTNYLVQDVGGHETHFCIDDQGFPNGHTYQFVWSANAIKWYVDGVWKHTEPQVGSNPWPTSPGRIMMNLWSGTTAANTWLGPFTYPNAPITATYTAVSYAPPP